MKNMQGQMLYLNLNFTISHNKCISYLEYFTAPKPNGNQSSLTATSI